MKEGNWKKGAMEMSVLETGEECRDGRKENGERDGIGLFEGGNEARRRRRMKVV